jgi:hypothetical protein
MWKRAQNTCSGTDVTGSNETFIQDDTGIFPASLTCTRDLECLNGQYCALDVRKCFNNGDATYKEICVRHGGNIYLIAKYIGRTIKL